MSVAAAKPRLAAVADLLTIPEAQRFHELIDGELVRKAMPGAPHSRAQARLTTQAF